MRIHPRPQSHFGGRRRQPSSPPSRLSNLHSPHQPEALPVPAGRGSHHGRHRHRLPRQLVRKDQQLKLGPELLPSSTSTSLHQSSPGTSTTSQIPLVTSRPAITPRPPAGAQPTAHHYNVGVPARPHLHPLLSSSSPLLPSSVASSNLLSSILSNDKPPTTQIPQPTVPAAFTIAPSPSSIPTPTPTTNFPQSTVSPNSLNTQATSFASGSASRISTSTEATVGVILALIVFLFCILLQKRLREGKDDVARRKLAQMDTKESSFFGGSDRGDVEKVAADASAMGTTPSWVDGFMDQLHLPPVPAAPQWTRRGNGWQVLDSGQNSVAGSPNVSGTGPIPTFNVIGPPQPPHVHFADDPNNHNRNQNLQPRGHGYTSESDYRDSDCCSTESEAVIATAARVPTAQAWASPRSFAARIPPAASYNSIGGYETGSVSGLSTSAGQDERETVPPHLMVVNPSTSTSSTNTYSSYEGDSGNSRFEHSTPHESGGDVSDEWMTSDAMDMDSYASAAVLARAREPLRVQSKGKRHQSLADTSPRLNSDPFARSDRLRRSNTASDRQSAKSPVSVRQSPSTNRYPTTSHRPSRLSMATLMLTSYGEEGSIVPPFLETPSIGHGEEETGAEDEDDYEDVVLRDSAEYRPSRFSTSAPRSGPPALPLPPPPAPRALFTTAPQLTITSPSAGHISGYDFSSSSSAEGAFESLSQMVLAKQQPTYRSPTYSIYHMYDGDDESRRGKMRLSAGPAKYR